MLRTCTREDFERYADFAYALSLDASASGYPAYYDGIKTKADFLRRARAAFSTDTEGILLFECAGTVAGWIHYEALPDDRYLSTVSFSIAEHTQRALEEFCLFAQTHFPGYDLYLGFPAENVKALAFLAARGFERIEESVNHTAFLANLAPGAPGADVALVTTAEGFERFRALHDGAAGDMYWASERIWADRARWLLFVCLAGEEPVGCACAAKAGEGWYEIFGVDVKNGGARRQTFSALVSAVLYEAKRQGGKYVTFFCDAAEEEAVRRLGMTRIGGYVCCRKRLA